MRGPDSFQEGCLEDDEDDGKDRHRDIAWWLAWLSIAVLTALAIWSVLKASADQRTSLPPLAANGAISTTTPAP